MKKTYRERNIILLSSIFIASLVTANLIASKLVVICGVELSAGVLVIPVTFLMTDLLSELYGKKNSYLYSPHWLSYTDLRFVAHMVRRYPSCRSPKRFNRSISTDVCFNSTHCDRIDYCLFLFPIHRCSYISSFQENHEWKAFMDQKQWFYHHQSIYRYICFCIHFFCWGFTIFCMDQDISCYVWRKSDHGTM